MNTYRVGTFAALVGGHRNTVKEWDRDCGCAPRSAPHGTPSGRPWRRSARGPASPWTTGWMQSVAAGTANVRCSALGGSALRAGNGPCCCGFDGCGDCAETRDCAIRVVHRESLSPPAELVEDLMAVVPMFSGRPAGLRRHGQKIRQAAPDG
ncbi:MAG: hypothetical protein J4G06_10790 [Caldilineaceae bacterium]|nr:hypothetical protein [Caldilineaceae bacterium]